MNQFARIYLCASLAITTICLSAAHAMGLSDNIGGQKLSSYTVGVNFIGTQDVSVFPLAGETFNDPSNCAGPTSPSAVLPHTGDETYRLLLVQLMSAAATGQKLTLFLGDTCYDIGYGLKRPVIVGLRAYMD
jgi:hypothetical protein